MKRLLLSFLFFLLVLTVNSFAATYYEVGNGTNWSSTGSWATSSGGSSGVGPPTASDTVIFDSNSGNCTVDTTTDVAASVSFTAGTGNYSHTLTFTSGQKLTVSGSVTWVVGATLSGTGNLTIAAAGTLTSAALTFPGSLTFNIAGTVTLSGSWTNTGLVTYSAATVLNQTTSETLTTNGGLTMTSSSGAGTATIIMGNTGTWSGSGTLKNSLTFNASGHTITISGAVYYQTGTITYTAGTITQSSVPVLYIAGNCTLTTSGMTWTTIDTNPGGGAPTITLGSNLAVTTLTNQYFAYSGGYGAGITFTGAFNVTVGTLYFYANWGNNAGATLTFPASQTLTVTTALNMIGQSGDGSFDPAVMKSGTSSTSMYLNYTGTPANENVAGAQFTDVDASGSKLAIYNWGGSTLTRTVDIVNVTPANIGGIFIP